MGTYLRIGKFEDYFANPGLSRVINWQVFLFMETSGRAVLYNGTLQGSLFNNQNQGTFGKTEPFTGEFRLGISLVYRSYKLEIGQTLLSREFEGGAAHRWGYIGLKIGI